jgi:two-component system, chemotaxis family, chemotaxis protein CheY
MNSNRKRLLVVDDTRTSRGLIRGFISKLRPDWEIFEAASGEIGLSMLPKVAPHYVTMDVNMPGMSGLEAAGQIRSLYPEIRLSVCTGNVQAYVRDAARQAGVFFSPKPVTLLSMAEVVNYFELPVTDDFAGEGDLDDSVEGSFASFNEDIEPDGIASA